MKYTARNKCAITKRRPIRGFTQVTQRKAKSRRGRKPSGGKAANSTKGTKQSCTTNND